MARTVKGACSCHPTADWKTLVFPIPTSYPATEGQECTKVAIKQCKIKIKCFKRMASGIWSQISSSAKCPSLQLQQRIEGVGQDAVGSNGRVQEAPLGDERCWVLTQGSPGPSATSQDCGKWTRGLASRRGGAWAGRVPHEGVSVPHHHA